MTNFSDKFAKELDGFMNWIQTTEYTVSKDGIPTKWSEVLSTGFQEPSRNKLESYIKELLQYYTISSNGEKIDDYKLLAKEFKELQKNAKPKRKRSSSSQLNLSVNDNETDTSETYFLEQLDFTTEQLVSKLGQPLKAEKHVTKYRYEWKINMNGIVFSIYDWIDEDGEFDDFECTEWYLAGTDTANHQNITELINMIHDETNKKPIGKKVKEDLEDTTLHNDKDDKDLEDIEDIEDIEDLNDANKILSKEELKELFGEESDTESIVINLDEIPIDN